MYYVSDPTLNPCTVVGYKSDISMRVVDDKTGKAYYTLYSKLRNMETDGIFTYEDDTFICNYTNLEYEIHKLIKFKKFDRVYGIYDVNEFILPYRCIFDYGIIVSSYYSTIERYIRCLVNTPYFVKVSSNEFYILVRELNKDNFVKLHYTCDISALTKLFFFYGR